MDENEEMEEVEAEVVEDEFDAIWDEDSEGMDTDPAQTQAEKDTTDEDEFTETDDQDPEQEEEEEDPEPEPEAAEQPDEDPLEKERQRLKSWEGRLRKQEEELKGKTTTKAKPEDTETPEAQPDETPEGDDEDEDISHFRSEFDQISGPVEKMIQRSEERQKRMLEPILTKAEKDAEQAREDAEREHFDVIREAHEDLDDLLKPPKKGQPNRIEAYISKQPVYLQDALRRVTESGTADEVVDLLDRVKGISREERETGKKDTGKPPSKKRSSARAVPGRVATRPRTGVGATDFEDIWDEVPE